MSTALHRFGAKRARIPSFERLYLFGQYSLSTFTLNEKALLTVSVKIVLYVLPRCARFSFSRRQRVLSVLPLILTPAPLGKQVCKWRHLNRKMKSEYESPTDEINYVLISFQPALRWNVWLAMPVNSFRTRDVSFCITQNFNAYFGNLLRDSWAKKYGARSQDY